MPELNPTKRWLAWTVYATPLINLTTALGLSIRLSMFELCETGDWDIFLGPPERARAETGGADQWVLKGREFSGFARVNKVTCASLKYPLSVVNKNSALKGRKDFALEEGQSALDLQAQHILITRNTTSISVFVHTYEYQRPKKKWGLRKYSYIGD